MPPELGALHKTRVQGSRADILGFHWLSFTSWLLSVLYFTSGFEQSWGQASTQTGSKGLPSPGTPPRVPDPEAEETGASKY